MDVLRIGDGSDILALLEDEMRCGEMEEINQWTYVYWDTDNWYVYRQVPDRLCPKGRVISTEIARGRHDVPSYIGSPDYNSLYAAKQVEIGLQYATDEWPFKTCQGEIISK